MFTGLEPHRQAASMVMRLGGAAPDIVRGMTPQELQHGFVINSHQAYIAVGVKGWFSWLTQAVLLL